MVKKVLDSIHFINYIVTVIIDTYTLNKLTSPSQYHANISSSEILSLEGGHAPGPSSGSVSVVVWKLTLVFYSMVQQSSLVCSMTDKIQIQSCICPYHLSHWEGVLSSMRNVTHSYPHHLCPSIDLNINKVSFKVIAYIYLTEKYA